MHLITHAQMLLHTLYAKTYLYTILFKVQCVTFRKIYGRNGI